MPQRPEDRMKDELFRLIKKFYGDNVYVFKINDSCSRAYPDLMICFFGYFVAFECKNGNTPPKAHEPLQNHVLNCIKRANGFGCVIRSPQEGIKALTNIYTLIKSKSH